MAEWAPVLTLVIGAVLSGVVTFFGTRSKLRFDYDADLRKRRIEVYLELWRRLEPLAKYGRLHTFSTREAAELADSLREWYFHTGGLFLSTAARSDYFALQDVLKMVADGWGCEPSSQPENQQSSPGADHASGGGAGSTRQLTAAAREYLRIHASRLRSSLTRDVGTRSQPRLRGDSEPFDYAVAGNYEREGTGRLKLRFSPRALGARPRIVLDTVTVGQRQVSVEKWDADRSTFQARFDDSGGNASQRVVFFESGSVIDGPFPDQEDLRPAVQWKRK